ncbi:MAG: shikimate kinase [Bacteroidota bacterium]
MKIFLLGFMGCGKTTLGRKLATKLDYPFIDLDHQLEAETGMSVSEYFAVNGEQSFRELENKVLKSTAYPEDCVVSTGGGTPCFYDNMDFMNGAGSTVYIEMPPIALAKRLINARVKRPLIAGLDEAQLVLFIESKLAERNLFYRRASLTISGIDISPEKVKEQLFQVL